DPVARRDPDRLLAARVALEEQLAQALEVGEVAVEIARDQHRSCGAGDRHHLSPFLRLRDRHHAWPSWPPCTLPMMIRSEPGILLPDSRTDAVWRGLTGADVQLRRSVAGAVAAI